MAWIRAMGGGSSESSTLIRVITPTTDWFTNPNVTIKIHDDRTTYSGHFNSQGEYVHTVLYSGRHLIEVVDGDTTYTHTIKVETLGSVTEVTFVGYGYKGWLDSVGITTEYESLDDLFDDEKTVRQLMTMHDSADYILEWYNATPNMMPKFIANANAMKWIGLRDYICDKLMAIPAWKTAMLESDNWEYILKDKVPVMTSDSAPYGVASASSYEGANYAYKAFDGDDSTFWASSGEGTKGTLIYKFTNPINVKAFSQISLYATFYRSKDFVISASNDGTNWTNLYSGVAQETTDEQFFYFENENYYLYYKFYIATAYTSGNYGIGVKKAQFYGRSLNVSVPTMTSNNAPYGEVSSSGEYGSDNASWKAFSQNSSVIWMNNNSSACWIQYKFSNKISLGALTFLTNNSSNYTPQSFDLMASNDGSTWQTVQSYTPSCSASTKYTFSVNTTVSAKYWRIGNIVCTNSQYCQLGMIQFFGTDYSERDFDPDAPSKYLYDHGLELEEIIPYPQFSADGIFTKESDHFNIKNTTGTGKLEIITSNAIDLTNYSLVRGVVGANHLLDVGFGIWDGTTNIASSGETSDNLPYNNSLDISSINASYQLGYGANTGKSIILNNDVKEWYLTQPMPTKYIKVTTDEESWINNPDVTVTIHDGANSYTGKFHTDGSYQHSIKNTGSHLIEVNDSGDIYQKTVNVTEDGTVIVKMGIKTLAGWLEAGGVTEEFSDLNAVLADQITVRRLMTIHASADYLCDWVSIDESTRATIYANAYAMKWIGLRDYVCDKLMADYKDEMLASDNWEYILKDKVPVMTSDSAPYGEVVSGGFYTGSDAYYAFDGIPYSTSNKRFAINAQTGWLGYKFTNPICVKKIKALQNGTIVVSASNDNSNWTTITSSTPSGTGYYDLTNNNYYLYYRITITTATSSSWASCWELQFYGRSLNVSVPTMTSNNAPYGEASASSIYSSSMDAWKAFNGINGNNDWWASTSATSGWIEYKFTKNYTISAFLVSAAYAYVSYKLQCYKNGNWIDASDSISVNIPGNEEVYYATSSHESNRWRLKLESSSSSTLNTFMVNFFALDYSEREFAEGSNIKYIYDNGCELESIDKVGYPLSASFTNDGGFDFNDDYISVTMPTSDNHCRSMVSNSQIDLSSYASANVRYDGTFVGYFDTSSISQSEYLTIEAFVGSPSYYFSIYISPNKNNPATSYVAGGHYKSATSRFVPILTEWWLE